MKLRTLWLLPLLCSLATSALADMDKVLQAAMASTQQNITYNAAWFKIDYPGGDIPPQFGVCTDVIVRSYRAIGIDLQKEVHEDIRAHFDQYPARRIWNQTRPDTNIDHRRVPNLQTFFTRHGESLTPGKKGEDYQPGDMVTWMLPGNLPHIGFVSEKQSADGKRPLIIHNIGAGPKLEDMLFDYTITGQYRYLPN
ncbi:DUF1287 domain-containing protein [Cellvibrio polysaccharolyticus]|uniref:DUF1287 domain-containing protein n=1 Tax=Cellvibrio polysaccharolyticus TaxID=2082724 RepID=A0A928V522_9GAMM|nr:DUF1287 domain-containing protein [Cellvibrio polysaccharolyticus]MBE8717993.1 DUF1287 domain-containing protein [Cellvibrio polysaccharolyticus]